MKKACSILFAITVLFISTSVRADKVPERKYCSEGNQLEMNYCDARRFEQADKEMNRLYKKQLARMQNPKSIERFRDAQRAWVTFRDKVCLYEAGPREESGSIWISSESACMTYRTELRIKDLNEYLSCDTGKCPDTY